MFKFFRKKENNCMFDSKCTLPGIICETCNTYENKTYYCCIKHNSLHFRSDHPGMRIMHKAICSGCKNECEVPYKPTKGRDVFCRDCFSKQRR